MDYLIAQNGLSYNVNLIFLIPMNTQEFKKFNKLFGSLVNFVEKINDEGIIVHFILNIDEELSKFGRFKDVPGKVEINNYMPIIEESELFLKSDIKFLSNVIELYTKKENFKNRSNKNKEDQYVIEALERKVKNSINRPYIQIRNLIINP